MENLLKIKEIKRFDGLIEVFFNSSFFSFYFTSEEGIKVCILKLRNETGGKTLKTIKRSFEENEKASIFCEFIKKYKFGILEEKNLRNLNYPEFKRFYDSVINGDIKNDYSKLKKHKSYSNGKTLKEIVS